MERILYINEDFCAVAEDQRLVEFVPVDRADQTGQILRGRVQRMMPGLEAAFVDIGRKRAGFLPLKENSSSFQGGTVHSGDEVLVQIRKEEKGEKGAFLTRDLSIAGSFLILMPQNRHIGVSARITDEADRSRLTETGRKLSGGAFGLVMREAALSAEEDTLRAEMATLQERWERITQGEAESAGPAEELIRDYQPRGIDAILRNQPLSADLARQLSEAENRRIRLPHGGNIVIDQCEAMTVIDVNSASDAGGGSRRGTVMETNLEACREMMIQTRLRNLSGILILDMIDMETDEERKQILEALENAFRQDRIKTVIHGFTNLGLIEMTRKRSRPALSEKANK